MSATISLKLVTPAVPNFVQVERPPGQRQDGVKFGSGIDVGDLSVEQLNALADEWRTAFFANAQKRREPRP